ncbi:MAG: hypothetical protein KJ919_08510, partial [Verrucomicrobia bacterium]|nr:hypothetical protein [Verrucomicrobiota bacterium]
RQHLYEYFFDPGFLTIIRVMGNLTFVCARSGSPQTAQDRRSIFRTEFDTLLGERHTWVAGTSPR